jgi:hypothetical protein
MKSGKSSANGLWMSLEAHKESGLKGNKSPCSVSVILGVLF